MMCSSCRPAMILSCDDTCLYHCDIYEGVHRCQGMLICMLFVMAIHTISHFLLGCNKTTDIDVACRDELAGVRFLLSLPFSSVRVH